MGKSVLIVIGIGVVAGIGAIVDNQLSVPLSAVLWAGTLITGLFVGAFVFGGREHSLKSDLPSDIVNNPDVVIENVPGVGISVINENGKELIIREHGKAKVEIWKTDERGMVTGKPLIARREGEAAYRINEMLR